MNKIPKDKLMVALTAGGVIVILLLYSVVYAPLLRQLKAKYLECRAVETELSTARNIIESAGKVEGKKVLVTDKEAAQAIDEFTRYCSQTRITVLEMNPGEVRADPARRFKVLPIQMKITSNFQQFAAFAGSLAGLERSVIKLSGFDLAPDTSNRARLRASLALDIYLENAE